MDKVNLIKMYKNDPEDNYLERRLKESCKKQNIKIEIFNNPAFINTKQDL